jgi:Txe/YoeB family toxin of Txe-Axe toxin-antitoxin module
VSYQKQYLARFQKDLAAYQSLRARISKRIEEIAHDPYSTTERLGHPAGAINLKGCRSARVGRNFRIIFVVCEECKKEPECEYCFCDGLPDRTVLFLTVRPHDKAYQLR